MAKKPSKNSARNTFARPLSYPTRPVLLRDAFRRNSPIPRTEYILLGDLATELNVEVERLHPLLEHRYLKLIEAKEYLKDCTVARPMPAAMDWLRTMMAPVTMQPIFTIEMVADLLHCREKEVRTLCVLHNIPIHQDPAFGELITLRHFHRLYRNLYSYAGPARFDRQALLFLMSLSVSSKVKRTFKLLPYSRRVEAEIRRIAVMKEPDRSIRAMALLEAYRDAETIGECIIRYQGAVRGDDAEKIGQALDKLFKRSIDPSGQKQPDASSSDRTSLDEPFLAADSE